jgi:DNA-binding beta-propeller fold protein YncE
MKRFALLLVILLGPCCFARAEPVVLGHGSARYTLDLSWAKADPAVAPVVNSHALAEGRDGRIYLVTDHPKNDFIVFEKDGRYVRSISAGLGGGHGLEIFEKDGVEYLVHVDSGWHMAAEGWKPTAVEGGVTLLTTEGKVVRRFPTPAELGLKDGKFMPCDVAWSPAGTLLIADGYGSNFVYEFSFEGAFLRKWGGPTKDAANLNNAHGISIDAADPRGPLVWVPSRSQNQIKAFTLDGAHVDTIELPGAFAGQLCFRGDKIYTAVCWSKDAKGLRQAQSGFLLVLDRATKRVLSAPGGSEPSYVDGKLQPLSQSQPVFKHGHDLYVDSAGDIYLGEWNAERRYPSKLSLVK